jgi:hypothetical protein
VLRVLSDHAMLEAPSDLRAGVTSIGPFCFGGASVSPHTASPFLFPSQPFLETASKAQPASVRASAGC